MTALFHKAMVTEQSSSWAASCHSNPAPTTYPHTDTHHFGHPQTQIPRYLLSALPESVSFINAYCHSPGDLTNTWKMRVCFPAGVHITPVEKNIFYFIVRSENKE